MMRGFQHVACDSITSRANQRIDFPGLDDTLLLGGLDGESLLFPANLLVFGWGEHRSRELDVAGRSVSSWWGRTIEACAAAPGESGSAVGCFRRVRIVSPWFFVRAFNAGGPDPTPAKKGFKL